MSLPEHGYILYRSKAVLFQILFEHTVLHKVPNKAFVPWIKNTRKDKIKQVSLVFFILNYSKAYTGKLQ